MFNDTKEKWYSLPVKTHEGKLEELKKHLPEFKIHPFWGNEYLNVVARQPIGEDNQTIPVATVSKKYALIQHTDVMKFLEEGLNYAGLNTEQLTAVLKLSIYGERMHLIVNIPNYDFDPGDGKRIVMNVDCFNSVDKSCALQIGISWTRLVCTNGMMEEKRSSIRKIHNVDWMNRKNISDFLKKKFESAPGIYSAYKEWMNTKIEISKVEEWIEEELLEKWKGVNSLRALNIMRTGEDANRVIVDSNRPWNDWELQELFKVPGAFAPVRNVFHASQALSWIASRTERIENRLEMLQEIPIFMNDLMRFSSRNLLS